MIYPGMTCFGRMRLGHMMRLQASASRFFSKLIVRSHLYSKSLQSPAGRKWRGAFEPPRLYKGVGRQPLLGKVFRPLAYPPRLRCVAQSRNDAKRRNPRVDPIAFQRVSHRVRKVGYLADDEEYTPKCASNPHPSNTTTLTDAHPSPTHRTRRQTPPLTRATAPPPCLCPPPSATSDNALTLTTNPP